MPGRRLTVATLAWVALAVPVGSAAEPRARTLAADGAWSWFGDPRAVHHVRAHRRTYIGWVTSTGDIALASHDHDSGTTARVVLSAAFGADDHNNPSLHVRQDGRLMAFWTGHPAGAEMYYRVSTRAEDISEWGPTRVTGVNTPGVHGYAYPNPIRLGAEGDLIYLFWRGGNFQPSFSTSEDEGETWAPARTLIEFPGYRLRPYVKYATDGVATIHIAFTEAHPATYATSIYYLAYRAGALYRADGTLVASLDDLPVHPARADRVYAAAEHGASAWVYDVAHDEQGRPVIVYATFPSPRTDHRYRYARWTGDRWVDRELTPAGPAISLRDRYSGGIALDHEDPATVYLSRPVGGVFEIEGWQTRDGGATWSSEAITSGSRENNFRPFATRGLRPGADAELIWLSGRYRGWKEYGTALTGRFAAP